MKTDNENDIKKIIDSANSNIVELDAARDKPKNQPDKNTIDGKLLERYVIHKGRMCEPCFKDKKVELKPFCDFSALIIEEKLIDDGESLERVFRIAGKLPNGEPLNPIVEVSSSSFAGMGWVLDYWGSEALIYRGAGTKDKVRDCIQYISNKKGFAHKTIYAHTGWRIINDQYCYLHLGGAITPNGMDKGIEVSTNRGGKSHSKMALYKLPEPTKDKGFLAKAIRASMGLLNLAEHKPEIGAFLLAAIFRAPTAEAMPINHSGWIYGKSGACKTEAAALAMAHFGEFTSDDKTATFEDSPGSMELKSFIAKDSLLLIDDYKPVTGLHERNKLNSKVDQAFRGFANNTGRGTLTADRKERASYVSRGMVIATGEDLPPIKSLRARLVIVELREGDILPDNLTPFQRNAAEGLYRQVMANYLEWLSKDMVEYKATLREMINGERDRFLANARIKGIKLSHSRAASDFGSLMVGLSLFCAFIDETKTLTRTERQAFFDKAKNALINLIESQTDQHGEEDEVDKFVSLLQSALNAGRCHLKCKITQGKPTSNAHFWGWRELPTIRDGNEIIESRPLGESIGWVDNDELYLDGNAVMAEIHALARKNGEEYSLSQHSTFRRLDQLGFISKSTHEQGRRRIQVKASIAGNKVRVYVVNAKIFD